MIERFGSDKPDLRYGMELIDLAETFRATGFNAFASVLASKGRVKALVAPGGGSLSRKELDELVTETKGRGAAGLVWMVVEPGGDPLARGQVPLAGGARRSSRPRPGRVRAT